MFSSSFQVKRLLVTWTFVLLWGAFATAEDFLPQPTETRTLADGVVWRSWQLKEPVPRSIQALTIDTTKPNVDVFYSIGGADPDGSGEYHTTGMNVFAAAETFGYDLAINADELFTTTKANDTLASWGKMAVPCMVEGQWIEKPPANFPTTLRIYRDGHFEFDDSDEYDKDVIHVIRGRGAHRMLVRDGKPVTDVAAAYAANDAEHPRTVLGIDPTGKVVTILIVDGRRPDHANGLTIADTQQWMVGLGVDAAMNLGGGGNTIFVGRTSADGPLRILNIPSDRNPQGLIQLRSNRTTLGFRIYDRE